jgi:polysaccharide pyruvyl transferase WcaK-like protein
MYPSIQTTRFKQLAESYAAELCAAHETNRLLSVLLVAHDFRNRMRGDYAHEGLYMRDVQLTCARLCPSFPVRVFNEGQPYEPTQSKAAIARVHGVVSGFMHFLIISAGAGTPGLALTPLDKFYELYEDLYGGELTRALIVRRASEPGELRAAISRFVILLDKARANLAASLPRVRRMAGWNLDVLESGMCVAGVAGPCGLPLRTGVHPCPSDESKLR